MSIFKCKMCGGALEVNNESVATCEYCGTQQTLPKLDDDRKANLYDRANHFRRNNEFDKAMGIYEQILNEDTTDAEAYWSLVLCRYGIEYVEDPASRKRVPTVNRAQFTSIFDDDNYKSALEYADGYQRSIYEAEAKTINEIQKGILAISQKEEPFDVFICYKETDNNGRRTPDSVLANELYHQLTGEGFKVFFARITLEDKLGSAYEPYIFAALNSAKVMVVLGTKPEFFNAVWVKNEWSRYLALIKNGAKKMLIPAYRDMDPYDLPEEFSHLQAQDMSKLGFMQDLIRGIKKIIDAEAPKTTVIKETVSLSGEQKGTVQAFLDRGFMALEDSEWDKADDFFEQALNFDAKIALAYLGKLMAELRVKAQAELKDCKEPFDNSSNFQKAVRFADDALKAELNSCIEYINTRNENECLNNKYNAAKKIMNDVESEAQLKLAMIHFEGLGDYLDSKELAAECFEKAETLRKDNILTRALGKINGSILVYDRIYTLKSALEELEKIPGWKNAEELIADAKKQLEELKVKAEADRLERERQAEIARIKAAKRAKLIKKIAIFATIGLCILIAFIIVLNTIIIPNNKYNDAVTLMGSGNIIEAYEALVALDDYMDSADKANSIYDKYQVEKLKAAKVGDYVFFGAYEQDNNTSNGKEDIEWLVLEVKGGKALVISKYALDFIPYNTSYISVTWETCTLRNWLNNDFINSAFTTDEKEMIPTTTVSADLNDKYSTYPGKATKDKVFLLSVEEAKKYFNYSSSERKCSATKYAIAKKRSYLDSDKESIWWLRTPGCSQLLASYVKAGGGIGGYGYGVDRDDIAVRPAMWIDISNSK